MFIYLKRCLDPELDVVITILLKKDSTAFISETVELALKAACENCNESSLIKSLVAQGSAKSSMMKTKIMGCLEKIGKRLGNKILTFKDTEKIINLLAINVFDSSLDVRNAAKKGLMSISYEIINNSDFDKLLHRTLNETLYLKVKSIISKEIISKATDQLMITNQGKEYNSNNQNSQNSQMQKPIISNKAKTLKRGTSHCKEEKAKEEDKQQITNSIELNLKGSGTRNTSQFSKPKISKIEFKESTTPTKNMEYDPEIIQSIISKTSCNGKII